MKTSTFPSNVGVFAFRNLSVRLMMLLLMIAAPAFSQSTSTILGIVKDTSGAVVPSATVIISNLDTAQTRTVATDADGAYRVPGLPAGHYSAKVEKDGFKTETQQDLTLDVAQELSVNVLLQIGSTSQEIVVTGEASQVNTTSSSLGGLVNEENMADLPLNGRNYIDLSLMQPGVAQNLNYGTGGGMIGTFYSSNGAPTISNNFLLDGTPIVNQFGGSSSSEAGTTLGVDGIKEYRVVTNAFSAEYGMTMGSQMVMVSKGGTGQFHGDVFEYLRNSALDARNYFDPTKIPEFRRNNFGGSVGGPIKRDKIFFYAVYEGLRQDLGFTVLDQVPAAGCHGPAGAVVWNGTGVQPAGSLGPCTQLGSNPGGAGTNSVTINSVTAPLLTLYPNPTNPANNTYTFPTSSTASVNYGQIRVDENISSADTLFGRYTTDESAENTANNTGVTAFTGVAFPQFRATAGNRNQFITVSENHVFSAALLNTARLSFARTDWQLAPVYTTPLPGIPSIVSGTGFGALAIGGLSATGINTTLGPPHPFHLQNIYTFGDDVFYNRGRHALKLGILYNRYNDAMTVPIFASGSLTYASLATFLRAVPSAYNAASAGSNFNRDFIFNTIGLYVQDDWRTTSRLTLNLGLRYEFMTTPWELNNNGYAIRDYGLDPTPTRGPVMLNKTLLNFSPRLGFAWDVFGNGKTAVRGGFGIYYDVGNLGQAFTENAAGSPPSIVSRASGTGVVVPLPLIYSANQIGKAVSLILYNDSQPRMLQYNLTIVHQLPWNMVLSVGYVGTQGDHLWTEKEGNPTIPTYVGPGNMEYWATTTASCSTVVPSCRVNPNYTADTLDANDGNSWYNSLQVVVNKRVGHGLEFQGAYTYAHSLDTTEGALTGNDCTGSGMDNGVDPNFPRRDLGPSCFDVRHNLRLSLLYHFPTIKSDSFVAHVVNGWWIGNIVSVQGGYPFTPVESSNRSVSGVLTSQGDRVNIGTATVAPGAIGPDGHANTTTKTFVPFNSADFYTGNPNQWFNPLMFALQPMVPCPNNTALTCGTLGDARRGFLRGPGLGTWDFSLVKDTPVRRLGEQGSVEFRAEFFNLLNRANFGMPSGTIFSGTTADIGSYTETPLASAGQITSTATKSREIQLALKILF